VSAPDTTGSALPPPPPPSDDELAPAGVPQRLSDAVVRILAPNPSPMTGPGTNTYVVGDGPVVIVDPGPDIPEHVAAVRDLVGDRKVQGIVATHHHADHWPAAVPLAEALGARTYGHGHIAGGYRPSSVLPHGSVLVARNGRLRAEHTPGHSSDHLCLMLQGEKALFSGDHVMSGSTVVIAPPDGDMAEYMQSLQHVRSLGLERIYPAHGPYIDDPAAYIDWYVAHRRAREAQILDAVRDGDATVDEIVTRCYDQVPEVLHPVARFSVLAHLRKLADEELVVCDVAPGSADDGADAAPDAAADGDYDADDRDFSAPPESWMLQEATGEELPKDPDNPELPLVAPPDMAGTWRAVT
jgi:glyoxylase-like metal-dependent hydrolase (beta-lactamase superfamily II)